MRGRNSPSETAIAAKIAEARVVEDDDDDIRGARRRAGDRGQAGDGCVTAGTLFHRTGEHAADEIPLETEEHGQGNDDGEHRTRRDDPEVVGQSTFLVVKEQR